MYDDYHFKKIWNCPERVKLFKEAGWEIYNYISADIILDKQEIEYIETRLGCELPKYFVIMRKKK